MISIHALVKRATTQLPTRLRCVGISIHALVKRATTQIGRPSKLFVYFNPRPREEGDHADGDRGGYRRYFNPRPREEGDSPAFPSACHKSDFNPRPREEGDEQIAGKLLRGRISIHALVKRATGLPIGLVGRLGISIHALVKRATYIVKKM